jgi:hypothetical protein
MCSILMLQALIGSRMDIFLDLDKNYELIFFLDKIV